MKSTYCEYILEKILSTSEVGPILALIAPSPFVVPFQLSLSRKQEVEEINRHTTEALGAKEISASKWDDK